MLLLILINIVSAERYINYNLKEAIVSQNGEATYTDTPITNINVLGFVCADSKCNTVSRTLWNSQTLNSGDSDSIQLTYPTQLLSQYGYGIYYFKQGYIAWEQNPNWHGTNRNDPQGPYTKYLGKKQDCYAPIEDFTVINDAQPNVPLIINIDASLDATTYAAIHSTGPLNYIPNQLQEYYSVKTKITLTIYDSLNNIIEEQIKEISIPYSGSARVEFTWTPALAGSYKATAKTDVTDEKCISSLEQSTSKDFTVLSSQPQNSCYTLLNNLALSDQFPEASDTVTISATKISNYADNNYNLQPVPTDTALTITKDSNIIKQESKIIEASLNQYDPVPFSFDWSIAEPGDYNIEITGIASSPLCEGIPNLAETISLNKHVTSKPNNAPILEGIPDKTINENSEPEENWIDLYLYSSDDQPDAELTFSIISQSNPSLIECKINDDRYVDCKKPALNKYGYSDITVEVSDGQYTDRDTLRVRVLPINYPPYLNYIGNKQTNENQLLTFTISATDSDNDQLIYSASSLPSGAVFNQQTFTWIPSYTQSGSYQVTFTVSDSQSQDSETITITVSNVNQAPIITSTPSTIASEGIQYTYPIISSDIDNDPLTYSLITAPTGMTIASNIISWTPSYTQSGNHDVTIQVSDSSLTATQSFTITVSNVNRAPSLQDIADIPINENEAITITAIASDPDNDILTYNINDTRFTQNNNIFTWQTDYDSAGTYIVTIIVSDGILTDSKTATITINNVNRAPAITSTPSTTASEGTEYIYTIIASDPDLDPLTYSLVTFPAGMTIASNIISWIPSYTQSGNHDVTIQVSDSSLTATQSFTITVDNINRAPILSSIGNKQINEAQLLTFIISAIDQDNDALTYSASSLPSGSTFDTSTQTFTWTPSYTQSGSYDLTFMVSDGSLTDLELITITVNNINQAPIITSTPSTSATEGTQYTYAIIAIDIDNDPLTYSLTTAPTGMTIASNIISWIPSYTQSGNHDVTIQVSDSSLSVTQSFTIAVSNTNRAPILSSIGNKNINEAQLLTFIISATDQDNDALTYSASSLPSGSTFDTSTQTFTWTPSYTQSSSYQITFTVSDSQSQDSETITINVGNLNRAPTITSNPILNATEDTEYIYQVIASDPDNDTLYYYLAESPSNMTIDTLTGLITWTPTFEEAREEINRIIIIAYDTIDYAVQSFEISMKYLLHKQHKFSFDITPITENQILNQGDNYQSYIRLSNKGQLPEEDIAVSVSVPELNINFIAEQNIYLGPHDIKYAEINFDIPESALSGEYLIKVNVENNNYNAVGYSTLEIKENKKKEQYILLLP